MEKGTSNTSRRKSTLAVLGMGHIGLPTALGLAEIGWEVVGADADRAKIGQIRQGRPTFYEPGLDKLLSKHLRSGRLRLTGNVEEAIRAASVIFLCVGTPQRETGEANMAQVEAAARSIARNLNGYKLIVEKSTVPALTGQFLKKAIHRYAQKAENGQKGNGNPTDPSLCFEVASNPEFLQEGNAVQDFFRPARIVCGVESERARDILLDIYRPLGSPVLVTDLATAELIKYAANAFLATKISFINMISDLCESTGTDVTAVARGIGLDPRIGPDFLKAGIGFGGYCLPKDLRAFIHLAEQYDVDFSLLRAVEEINQRRVEMFLQKVRKALWVLEGKTLGLLGLAFKPGTDDVRDAPSLKLIEALRQEGVALQLYDPKAMPEMQRLFPKDEGRLTYCSSPYQAAQGADALLLLTEWDEFQNLDWDRLHDLMQLPIVLDGRNLCNPSQVRQAGFEYVGIGRNKQFTGIYLPSRKANGGQQDSRSRIEAPLDSTPSLDQPTPPGGGNGVGDGDGDGRAAPSALTVRPNVASVD
jgi:UDPglucose 6-dehydrogenase